MATVSVNTFLDGGTLRTAGENWTMSLGAILTIRTDTRWHADAPAGMLGSIGTTTTAATSGGGVLVDSRAVRWMPFDNGAGNVPAIGETITGGTSGSTGYLLGVWADYTSAPTAPGAAMPATGYIKLREASAAFVNNDALTSSGGSGMTADANGVDRQGWIEIVQDGVVNTVSRLASWRTRGDWFELDQVTSGSANDVIQIPTNGGGSGTHVPAVWIETTAGSGVYDKYPAILSTWFLAANLGTDDRCKFVQTIGSGQVRIGYDGTSNAGYVPPAGCKIRIPSNIGRQTSAANRALNLAPAALSSRPRFTTTNAGVIDFEYFMNDWWLLFGSPYSVRIKHSAGFDKHETSGEASPTELENYCTGCYTALGGTNTFIATNNFFGGTITDCKFFRAETGASQHSMIMTSCADYTLAGTNETGIITYARNATSNVQFTTCRDIVQTGTLVAVAETVVLTTCVNMDFERIRYVDRLLGTTNSTTGKYVMNATTACDNIIVRNLDFGGYTDVHPYAGILNVTGSNNITFRNGGTFASPIGSSTNAPGIIFADGGGNSNIKVQNIFLVATRTSLHSTQITSRNFTFERVQGTVGDTRTLSANTLNKGVRSAANSVSIVNSAFGSHVFDMFESDTAGRVWWAMNEPTAFSNSFVTLTLAGGYGGFTAAGQVGMPTVGDELIITMPYYAVGHTAFDNSAPTLTGTSTSNLTYEYDLDVNDGNGFTGSYQTLNGTNLSAETISPSLGFKLRLRITTNTGASNNALSYVRINTDSTAAAQANGYPLDTATPTLTLDGLVVGTTVVVFNDDYSEELDREVLVGTTYEYPYAWDSTTGDFDVNILVWKDDRVAFVVSPTLGEVGETIFLSQDEDLTYTAYTNTHTIDFANELIILDSDEYKVPEVYSLWKDTMLLTTNAQYDFAFTQVGGNSAGGTNTIPFYTFLSNGWKVRPQEADGVTNVIDGILVSDDDSDPFVDTLGAYTVRINYQQPVQAIGVSGGSGLTPTESAKLMGLKNPSLLIDGEIIV